MGTLIAAIIIIALIFYALKDLLMDKDFSAWTNIALTALILFTVILSIFMILHKPSTIEKQPVAAQEEVQPQPESPATPPEEMTEEQVKEAIAEEYVAVEADCKKNTPKEDCAKAASDFLIRKYKFTDYEWTHYLQEAADQKLFQKAREKQNIKK